MKKRAMISFIAITLVYLIIFLYFVFMSDIEIFNNKFSRNLTELNLTGYPIDTSKEWMDKLNRFNKLKTVTSNDKTITKEEKNKLEKEYPNITFNIVPTINVYGTRIKENEKNIDLSNMKVDSKIIDILNQFTNLENVKFSDQEFEKKLQLKMIEKYPNTIFEWNVKILDKTIYSDITDLDLKNANIENIDDFKDSLKLLQNLKYLNLSDCNLSNEQLAQLREDFPNIKIVWRIYFGVWSMQTDQVSFSVLITNFPYTRLKSSDLEILKYTTDLQALDLGHQAITDVTPIVNYAPNLRILILADNRITDITPLSKLKHLHYLELFINRITDLSPLVECKELVDLNLANVFTLSDASPLLNNDFPVLERLWINNTGISYSDYLKLKEKYPNATIINYGNGSTNSGWRTHDRYYAMINMYYNTFYMNEAFSKYDK